MSKEVVKVKMETRFFVECPRCGAEIDVDSYEVEDGECYDCFKEFSYNSEPENCEVV